MFQNYLKSAFRHIKKQKIYSLITLAGLTIGMTCFVLISLYVRYEFSYDKFHSQSDHIYRVIADTSETYMGKSQVAITPAPLASAMEDELAEIIKATKVTAKKSIVTYKEERFPDTRIYYADPTFLRYLPFRLR